MSKWFLESILWKWANSLRVIQLMMFVYNGTLNEFWHSKRINALFHTLNDTSFVLFYYDALWSHPVPEYFYFPLRPTTQKLICVMHCVALNILFCFVWMLLFTFFIWFHPSAPCMPGTPPENLAVSRLLVPTQASLSRSRSTVLLPEQSGDPGKRGQAGDTKENTRSGVG